MRSMTLRCEKGHPVVVERALAWWCPRCPAPPGAMCVDQRGDRTRVLNRPHPERTALRQAADDAAFLVRA